MNDRDFWNSVRASEEEKTKGTYYLRERGLEEHFKVLFYLESFRKNKNQKVTYQEIATVLRYDKRIRRCLFKYIGVIEERLRAHFLDKFRENLGDLIRTKEFIKLYIKNNDLYLTITHLTFGPLINLFKKQKPSFKEDVFGEIQNMSSNLDALVYLRNQVYHNKFLLCNRELKECKYDGVKQNSLYANLKNLYHFSDVNCKKSLLDDIKKCSLSHRPKHKNQVNWKLPDDVIICLNSESL